MAKICPRCNIQNRDSAHFCSNCRETLPLSPGTLLERDRFEIVRSTERVWWVGTGTGLKAARH